ncbi:unnamed protein product [Echinostoma caproni]|uniref:Uncharacterized protein n=1 Tax=Echinostoma caproni TaxID=27848 RepID=A0A183BH55_9TREM|nr:unnamed protein product [Echinostoma caproni]
MSPLIAIEQGYAPCCGPSTQLSFPDAANKLRNMPPTNVGKSGFPAGSTGVFKRKGSNLGQKIGWGATSLPTPKCLIE